MFYLIIPIFFRVIPHEKLNHLFNSKPQPKDLTRCQSLNGDRYTNNEYTNYLINCEVPGTSFGFYGTTFSGHSTTTGEHMLHIINVNFFLHDCPITNCGFLSAMIYCHGDAYTYSMMRNTISQCNNQNTPVSNANIIDADCKSTTIQDNTITFANISNSCRAFSIGNSRGCVFTGNHVTNGNVGTGNSASGALFSKIGTGDPIQISNCNFNNCLGGNGAVLSINDLNHNIELNELTIENTKNEFNSGSGYLILLNYNGQYVNPEAKFIQCHFRYLESDASSGGSIGLWFKGNKLNMSLIFDRTTFEHLHYLRSNIGGAITFIKENSNKDTHLTLTGCEFNNCSSLVGGAAICYCVPSQQLTIESTSFRNTYCSSPGEKGGAIYVEYQDETQPIVIRNCVFENTTSNNCKGNAIVLMQNNNNNFHFGSLESCSFTNCGSSGFVIYYTIAIVTAMHTNIVFTEGSSSCGGIHKDDQTFSRSDSLLPKEIVLNAPSKSNKRYEKVVKNSEKPVILRIEACDFKELYQDSNNGGAIHLIDCGLSCKKSKFIKCSSKSGGGAIYIKNDLDLVNTEEFEDILFTDCQATYGGAVYINTNSVNNIVSIKSCKFSSNQALISDSKTLLGGSAVFLAARKGIITDCTFVENKGEGGSLRINNNFDTILQGKDEEASVIISNCNFKIQKSSKCSLFYVRGNGKSSFELKNCLFTGTLAKNAHFIDGQSLVKEAPKLQVKSCKFSYDSINSLNLDPNNDFLAVDLKDQVFNYSDPKNEEEDFCMWKIIVAIIVPTVVIVVIIIVVGIVIKKKYSNRNIIGDGEMAEDLSNNDESSLKQTLI